MIDIHTHILFNIDDGSDSIEESIEIIKKYYKKGIRHIVLTPHYIENTDYNCNNKNKKKLLKELEKRLEEESIDIKLYMGNEVYISKNIVELLKNKEIETINNSRYLLLELPFISEDQDTLSIIHDLVLSNIIPIIAHPERYDYIEKDLSKLEKMKSMGALLQVNTGSLYGKYGKSSKKTVKKILKKQLADFIATDVHHSKRGYKSARQIKRKISSLANKKYAKKILKENQVKVLFDEDIRI